VFAVEELPPNLLSADNYGFEGVTDVKKTIWYKLVDANGNKNLSDTHFKNLTIKTDGGHTGKNYLSMTAEESWYSPSFDAYPIFKKAGEGTYVISFYYRPSSSYSIPNLVFRARAEDSAEEGVYDGMNIIDRNNGNFYANQPGKSYDPDANGWRLYVSEPIELVAEQFETEHKWYFCIDQTPAKGGAPFTIDIDDFIIVSESEFEYPEEEVEVEIETDISYLDKNTVDNVFPVYKAPTTNNNSEATVTETPEATVAPTATAGAQITVNEGMSTGAVIGIAVAALVVLGAVSATVTLIIKKKKN
jgi:hypothetical protein